MQVIEVDSVDAARHELIDAPSPVVVVPVYNAYDDTIRCYESLLRHTPENVSILIVDDCGADRRPIDALIEQNHPARHHVVLLRRQKNGGFVEACNDAFAATPRRDVVLVNSDVVVGPEWLERLTDAANSSSLIGTASTITNHGTILSVPVRNLPDGRIVGGLSPDAASVAVAKWSLKLRPTIPTAVGHCVFIKRTVLDTVGDFDGSFGTGYGEEVDFSQRAVRFGFRHVCADDVFTYHRGSGSFGHEAQKQRDENSEAVSARYRWYNDWVERAGHDPYSSLALALERAKFALCGVDIGVEVFCLSDSWAGTHTVAFETVRALSRRLPGSTLKVFHYTSMGLRARKILSSIDNVELVQVEDTEQQTRPPVDVMYRPYQVNTLTELSWLRRHGHRVVVNHLDMIGWSNPSYFASEKLWCRQRDVTRLALSTVDGVAFISEFARLETQAELMLPVNTPSEVVYCGTDGYFGGRDADDEADKRPSAIHDDETPLLLCLGVAYHHKNRPFAIKVLAELRRRGWQGRLVLAGAQPLDGHSLAAEAQLMFADPELRHHVVELGEISPAEKSWLYRRAALVLYPTISEGFGLVPFEAARHNVPTLMARQGSLDEVLPTDVPTLTGYDVGEAADLALRLLNDRSAADDFCRALCKRADEFSWDRSADRIVDLVDRVIAMPRNRVAGIWAEGSGLSIVPAEEPDLPDSEDESESESTEGRHWVKRVVAPEGSRRQGMIRRFANFVRRKTS